MKTYDLIVIGGGGGLKLVGPALKKNKKIAVIEKDRLGGTCLNRGCIPSKMLIHPADVALEIKNAKRFDLRNNPKISTNFSKLIERISNVTYSDSMGVKKSYNSNPNIDFYNKEAKFISDKEIKVGKEIISGKNIIIAVGARPAIPPIEGLSKTPYWTSTDALRAKKLPKSLVVIGGGYIGVELGHAYSALGSKVSFLVRGKMIAREDSQIIERFESAFAKEHNLIKEVSTDKVEYKNKKFIVTYSDLNGKKKKITTDALLVATGVKPNNDTLGLENTSIKLNERGFIKVDKYMKTDVKNIYAIGDCVGNYMFRHSVNFEGEYLADVLFGDNKKAPSAISYPPMPHAIFTNPQIAGVGYTEDELKEKKIDYVVGYNEYKDSAMGMALLEEVGFCKLLFDKKTKKLLGAHIIGPEASDMIHMCIAYITMKATVNDMLNMIYVHPALPEIVRNCARKAEKLLR